MNYNRDQVWPQHAQAPTLLSLPSQVQRLTAGHTEGTKGPVRNDSASLKCFYMQSHHYWSYPLGFWEQLLSCKTSAPEPELSPWGRAPLSACCGVSGLTLFCRPLTTSPLPLVLSQTSVCFVNPSLRPGAILPSLFDVFSLHHTWSENTLLQAPSPRMQAYWYFGLSLSLVDLRAKKTEFGL